MQIEKHRMFARRVAWVVIVASMGFASEALSKHAEMVKGPGWTEAVKQIQVRPMPRMGYRTGDFPGVIAINLPRAIGFSELNVVAWRAAFGRSYVSLSGSRTKLENSLNVGAAEFDHKKRVVRIPIAPRKGLDAISRTNNYAWWVPDIEIPKRIVPNLYLWRASIIDPTGTELFSVGF